jgi:outer membrane protein OmpA-like peptidoglycan-associated protein
VTAEAEAEQAKRLALAAEQEKQAAVAEAERIRKEREDELSRLQEALQKIAETRRTAMGLMMNLDSNAIQFEFNKAVLLSVNRELLSRIAGILLTSKGYSIKVHGHTDDVGSDAYNLELSEKRAQAVRDYLVQAGIGARSSPPKVTERANLYWPQKRRMPEPRTGEWKSKSLIPSSTLARQSSPLSSRVPCLSTSSPVVRSRVWAFELVGCLQQLTCGKSGGTPWENVHQRFRWLVCNRRFTLDLAHTALARLFRNFKNLAHLNLVRIA